ncbi:MAG: lamin tail domain-containing protein [Pseudonocardiaceae bacterium]
MRPIVNIIGASSCNTLKEKKTLSMIQTGILELDSPNATEVKGGQTSTFTSVTFATPFPQGSEVAVIPMVQTFNGPDTPGIRITQVTTKGFLIRMNELVGNGKGLSDGKHNQETIGWLACTVDDSSRSAATTQAVPAEAPASAPPPAAPPPAARLTVSGLDCKNELVTITNEGESSVDLDGWKIHDRNNENSFTFPPGTTLAPGATVSVRSGKTKPKPGEIAWTNRDVWNNSGDTATLLDPSGAEVSTKDG